MEHGLIQTIKSIIILWLARRLPDCKQMTRALGESLDRRPSWRERLTMKLHVLTCEACERYVEQVAFLKQAMHAHGDQEPESREFTGVGLSSDSKLRMKTFVRSNIGLAV